MKKNEKKNEMKEKLESYTKDNDYKKALQDMGVKEADETTKKMWRIADEILELKDRTDDISIKQEKRLIEEFKKLGKAKWRF